MRTLKDREGGPKGIALKLSPARARRKFSNKERLLTHKLASNGTDTKCRCLAWLAFPSPLLPDYTSAGPRPRARQDQPAPGFHSLFHSFDDPVVHAGDLLLHHDALDAAGLVARRRSVILRLNRCNGFDLPDRDARQIGRASCRERV